MKYLHMINECKLDGRIINERKQPWQPFNLLQNETVNKIFMDSIDSKFYPSTYFSLTLAKNEIGLPMLGVPL